MVNSPTNTHWSLDPKVFGFSIPFGLTYLVLDADTENYEYTMVGVPNRAYLWIMVRDLPSEHRQNGVLLPAVYEELAEALTGESKSGAGAYSRMPHHAQPCAHAI